MIQYHLSATEPGKWDDYTSYNQQGTGSERRWSRNNDMPFPPTLADKSRHNDESLVMSVLLRTQSLSTAGCQCYQHDTMLTETNHSPLTCWLSHSNSIWPVKTCHLAYLQMFSCIATAERKSRAATAYTRSFGNLSQNLSDVDGGHRISFSLDNNRMQHSKHCT